MATATPLDHVGRYRIIGEVGKGAMGVVYRATDPTIGRTVALKTMRVDVHGIEAEEMLQRFRNEAKAAGVMNHSNIVTVYDAGEQDGLFYIAMECIEGVTLHRLQETLADLVEVLGPARQVVIAREVTKLHEEFLRGHAEELRKQLQQREIKGEITLLIRAAENSGGGPLAVELPQKKSVRSRLAEVMQERQLDEKAALKVVARERGVSKSEAYRELQRSKP